MDDADEGNRPVVRPLDDEELYVYSEDDLADILSDAFVDLREVVADDQAADCVSIVYDRLTDDYYTDE